MIEKMSFVTLAGPKTEIDHMVNTYLSKYDIQLENALTELGSDEQFTTFSENNPYKEILNKSHSLLALIKNPQSTPVKKMGINKAEKTINKVDAEINGLRSQVADLESKKHSLEQDYNTIAPFKTLNYEIKKINELTFFKFCFGRLPRTAFEKFESYLDPDLNEIFITCLIDSEYVYGVYFTPTQYYEAIEKDLKNIHFDKIDIPKGYDGFPNEDCLIIAKEIAVLNEQIKALDTKINTIIELRKENLLSACRRLEIAYGNFDVRKLAACTKESGITFHVLCGWMTTKEALKLKKDTEDDVDVVCLLNDNVEEHETTPPTKLRNSKFIRPFELFVKMYGLPAYNEFDPTLFLTITYAFIFGIMFGDLGQGLCLLLGGLIIYKFKRMALAGIVCISGVFSCIFGALFGSFFGFEFHSVISPLESKIQLPFLGEINIVLVAAFLFGAFMILVTMIINIVTSIKQKDLGKTLFGPNALTGFIFYGAIISVILLYMTGNALPGTIVMIIMFAVPLVLIFLEEPLKNLIRKKHPLLEDSFGIFGATAFFELFDYLLTYLSNSLSFLRIGVFAISHAAMMQVVMTLAGAENGGSANLLVVILGNVIVLAMEGLVVGIQVLRLEYYELFGRFYEGSGREFIPYTKSFKH